MGTWCGVRWWWDGDCTESLMITEPLAKKRGARERLTSLQLQLEEMGDEINIPFHSFTNYSMNIFYKSLTVVWIALLLYGVTMIVVSIPQEIESDNAYVATELLYRLFLLLQPIRNSTIVYLRRGSFIFGKLRPIRKKRILTMWMIRCKHHIFNILKTIKSNPLS
jgi:hypothetical protein